MKFPAEEYIGVYVSHGRSTTVFEIKSAYCKKGRFDGAVLKIRRGQVDDEPAVMRQLPDVSPKGLCECIGKDGNDEYHCWVMERCIPLNQFAVLNSTYKDTCVLAGC